MEFDNLLFERRDGVAYVTLNRPETLNALNTPLIADLRAAAAAIDADARLRCVLLTGHGRGFSSGADLARDDYRDDLAASVGENIGAILRDQFNPMVLAWYELRVPLVVAVNGIAAGAGMSLALLGDIVIAARSAKFLQSFAPKLGLMPDLGSSFMLPRLIGSARAKGMTLLGEPVPAEQAVEWGLIWECVDDVDLLPRAETVARRLARGPTEAFKHIKSVFDRQPLATLAEQLALEARSQAVLADTQDFSEGVRAFREKRPPQFNGR